jgi:large subunit ribosomal protein L37Ae
MVKTKKVKAAGRYGARYGRSVRVKISDIEAIQRKKQTCIFCNGTAKRLSKGIWLCKKCGKKFASHTYYLAKKEEQKIK